MSEQPRENTPAWLHVLEPAHGRDIIITDGAVSFNLDADREFHSMKLCRDAHDLDAGAILQRIRDWLDDVAPMALVQIQGTIPPGHPLGMPR